MTSTDGVQIIFATDDNYVDPLTIVLFSILENRKSPYQFNFHIISKELSSYNRKLLTDLINSYAHTSIHFLTLDAAFFQYLDTSSNYISDVTYYRFAIPSLFPHIKKALYLDCDLVVDRDIIELWNFDLEGKSLGAIAEKFVGLPAGEWLAWHYNRLGFAKTDTYFNAGVLLLDLDRW